MEKKEAGNSLIKILMMGDKELTLSLSTLKSMLIIIQCKVHCNVHTKLYYRC